MTKMKIEPELHIDSIHYKVYYDGDEDISQFGDLEGASTCKTENCEKDQQDAGLKLQQHPQAPAERDNKDDDHRNEMCEKEHPWDSPSCSISEITFVHQFSKNGQFQAENRHCQKYALSTDKTAEDNEENSGRTVTCKEEDSWEPFSKLNCEIAISDQTKDSKPNDSDYVPDDSGYVPEDSDYAPEDSEYAPEGSEYVQDCLQKDVPEDSNYGLENFACDPGDLNDLKGKADFVPLDPTTIRYMKEKFISKRKTMKKLRSRKRCVSNSSEELDSREKDDFASPIENEQKKHDVDSTCAISAEKNKRRNSFTANAHDSFNNNDSNNAKCHECGKRFTRRYSLVLHERVHTGERPFVCQVCGIAFKQRGDMVMHRRTHAGLKELQCKICNRSFLRKGDLNRHIASHEGEEMKKNHVCTSCGKRFSRKYRLNDHLKNIHAIEVPDSPRKVFQCEVCDRTFADKSNQKRHTFLHTGEKPFKCPVCEKGFSSPASLTVHKRIHSKKTPFSCEIGTEQFRKHIKTHNTDTGKTVSIN